MHFDVVYDDSCDKINLEAIPLNKYGLSWDKKIPKDSISLTDCIIPQEMF